jgi:hypothetical protein
VAAADVTLALTEATGALVTRIRECDLLMGVGNRRIRSEDDRLALLQLMKRRDAVDIHLARLERTRFGVRHETWKARLVVD